jgi:hypothetical protein
MTFIKAVGRAIRDSMLVGWLLLGAFTLATVFSIRAGMTWRTVIPLMAAAPLVVHCWARALCRMERRY